jgi:hypothetical protein
VQPKVEPANTPERPFYERKPDPVGPRPAAPVEVEEDREGGSPLATIAGLIGIVGLVVSVVLAIGALLVAVGAEFGPLTSLCDLVVGPLDNAFDFSGEGAERKENFLSWGAGSVIYLLLSFAGQAIQRANADNE